MRISDGYDFGIEDGLVLNGWMSIENDTTTITLPGDWLEGDSAEFVPQGGTVFFYGDSVSRIRQNERSHFPNFLFNKPDTGIIPLTPLDINGDFTMQRGKFPAFNFEHNFGGDWNNLGGLTAFLEDSSTIIFDGTDKQYLGDETFYNLGVDGDSAHLIIEGNPFVDGDVFVRGGILDVSSHQLQTHFVDVSGELRIGAGGLLALTDSIIVP